MPSEIQHGAAASTIILSHRAQLRSLIPGWYPLGAGLPIVSLVLL